MTTEFSQHTVAISTVTGGYPVLFPFDPDEHFPEYRGSVSDTLNPVYRAVRKNFMLLGYDKANYGTPGWNPLGCFIRPGQRVFIKPNLCSHEYGRKKENVSGDLFCIITHPSVVRAVADFAAIALEGKGEIIIGDNSTVDTDFGKLMEVTGYDKFAEFYQKTFGVRCTVLDLREVWCDDINNYGNKSLMKRLPGDPRGDTIINLSKNSFFYGINPLLFRGVFAGRWETIRHHYGKTHEYAIANSVYQSDVYISVPKLKTHHKVGATLNIKGLVGICTKKNYLIHWRIGFPSWGGDEYPAPARAVDHLLLALNHFCNDLMPEVLRKKMSSWLKGRSIEQMFHICPYRGAWEGNDTCWRMAADLYLALMSRDRKCLSVVDGVVGGDGNGPFCAGRREARTIISGENLMLVDAVAVRMMDFDVNLVRYLTGLLKRLDLDLAKTVIISGDYDVSNFFTDKHASFLAFAPPSGWPHLQLKRSATKTIHGGHS
jgi:uncharacterized protein (DUF362 family)